MHTTPTTDRDQSRETARRARVQEISDAAIVREHFGQGATHRRAADGAHVVAYYDHHAGVLRIFSRATLDEAIAAANCREESP